MYHVIILSYCELQYLVKFWCCQTMFLAYLIRAKMAVNAEKQSTR